MLMPIIIKCIAVVAYVYSYVFSFVMILKSKYVPDYGKSYEDTKKSADLIMFGDGINDFAVFVLLLCLNRGRNPEADPVILAITFAILICYLVCYCVMIIKFARKYKEYLRSLSTTRRTRPVYWHVCVFKNVIKILITVVFSVIVSG